MNESKKSLIPREENSENINIIDTNSSDESSEESYQISEDEAILEERHKEDQEEIKKLQKALAEKFEYLSNKKNKVINTKVENSSLHNSRKVINSSSQNNELSKKIGLDIKKIRDKLIAKYQDKQYTGIESLFESEYFIPVGKYYIELAIIKEEEQKAREKVSKEEKQQAIYPGISSYEQIYKPKEPIKLEEVFAKLKEKNRNEHKETELTSARILILGQAGIGKSTISKSIAYRWTEGLWKAQYPLLLYIPLRALNDSEIWEAAKINKSEYEILAEHFEQVLIMADGYDELSKNGLKQFQKILDHFKHIIITSRPQNIRNFAADLHLEILGFSPEEIDKFIENYFKETQKEKNILPMQTWLKQQPVIRSIMRIPLNTELICLIWQDKLYQSQSMFTITLIYQELMDWLMRRYLIKREEKPAESLPNSLKTLEEKFFPYDLTFLEELAWKMMQSTQLYTHESCDHLKPLGLIRKSAETRSKLKGHEYYFIHLTFQEFFAARYISKRMLKNDFSYFTQGEYLSPRYMIVNSFIAGLLKEDLNKSEYFFQTLLQETKATYSTYSFILLMVCYEECAIPGKMKKEVIESLISCCNHYLNSSSMLYENPLFRYFDYSPKLCLESQFQNYLAELFSIPGNFLSHRSSNLLNNIFYIGEQLCDLLFAYLENAENMPDDNYYDQGPENNPDPCKWDVAISMLRNINNINDHYLAKLKNLLTHKIYAIYTKAWSIILFINIPLEQKKQFLEAAQLENLLHHLTDKRYDLNAYLYDELKTKMLNYAKAKLKEQVEILVNQNNENLPYSSDPFKRELHKLVHYQQSYHFFLPLEEKIKELNSWLQTDKWERIAALTALYLNQNNLNEHFFKKENGLLITQLLFQLKSSNNKLMAYLASYILEKQGLIINKKERPTKKAINPQVLLQKILNSKNITSYEYRDVLEIIDKLKSNEFSSYCEELINRISKTIKEEKDFNHTHQLFSFTEKLFDKVGFWKVVQGKKDFIQMLRETSFRCILLKKEIEARTHLDDDKIESIINIIEQGCSHAGYFCQAISQANSIQPKVIKRLLQLLFTVNNTEYKKGKTAFFDEITFFYQEKVLECLIKLLDSDNRIILLVELTSILPKTLEEAIEKPLLHKFILKAFKLGLIEPNWLAPEAKNESLYRYLEAPIVRRLIANKFKPEDIECLLEVYTISPKLHKSILKHLVNASFILKPEEIFERILHLTSFSFSDYVAYESSEEEVSTLKELLTKHKEKLLKYVFKLIFDKEYKDIAIELLKDYPLSDYLDSLFIDNNIITHLDEWRLTLLFKQTSLFDILKFGIEKNNTDIISCFLMVISDKVWSVYFKDNKLYCWIERDFFEGKANKERKIFLLETLKKYTQPFLFSQKEKNQQIPLIENKVSNFSLDNVTKSTMHFNSSIQKENIMLIELSLPQITILIDLLDDPALKQILTEYLNAITKKISKLNQFLKISSFDLFRKNKASLLKEIQSLHETIAKETYAESDKEIVQTCFNNVILAIKRCAPPLKTENEKRLTENLQNESKLFEEQKHLHHSKDFQSALNQASQELKKIKSRVQVYMMHAPTDESFKEREFSIPNFLNLLYHHLREAGITPILNKEDNFTGGNFNQFLSRIETSDDVLLLGTESFRKQWYESEHTLQLEHTFLQLKRLGDIVQGNINPLQTTIIPYVLTGIRETAFPDELFPYQNTTIFAWPEKGYLEVFIDILANVYRVNRKTIAAYFDTISSVKQHELTIDANSDSLPFLKPTKIDSRPSKEKTMEQIYPEMMNLNNNNLPTQLKKDSMEMPSACNHSMHLTAALRKTYGSQYAEIKRLTFAKKTTSIEQSFIHLALVSGEEQKTKETKLVMHSSSEIREESISSFEAIYHPKQSIELTQIFEFEKRTQERNIVEGRAGIGKSTFCQFIAYHWAKGHYHKLGAWAQQIQAVIWLRLRNLVNYPTQNELVQCIYAECITKEDQIHLPYEVFKQQLTILEQQNRVLYLLDGYDEASTLPWLNQLFEKKYWLLTSRPYFVPADLFKKASHLEIMGFFSEDIPKYVQQFFRDFNENEKATTLLTFLEQNLSVKATAHIPIQLELICTVWRDNTLTSFDKKLNWTTLYQKIVAYLFKKFLENICKLNVSSFWEEDILQHEKCAPIYGLLEEMAIGAMSEKGLLLKPEMYKSLLKKYRPPNSNDWSSFYENVFKHVGILQGVNEQKYSLIEQDYYFIHLTFQEFFAASYFARCFIRKQLLLNNTSIQSFIQQNKYVPKYEIFWWFVAGLIHLNDPKQMDSFYQLFAKEHDLTYSYDILQTIRCLEESELSNLSLTEQMCQRVDQLITHLPSNNHTVNRLMNYLNNSPTLSQKVKVENLFIKILSKPDAPPIYLEAAKQYRFCHAKNVEQLISLFSNQQPKLAWLTLLNKQLAFHPSLAEKISILKLKEWLKETDFMIKREVIFLIHKVALINPSVFTLFLEILDKEASSLKGEVMNLIANEGKLSLFGRFREQLTNCLLNLLCRERGWVQKAAANALVNITQSNRFDFIDTLLQQKNFATIAELIATQSAEIKKYLLDYLATEKNKSMLCRIIEAFSQARFHDNDVITFLLNQLNHSETDFSVKEATVIYFKTMGINEERVANALQKTFERTQELSVKIMIIEALLKMDFVLLETNQTLILGLDSHASKINSLTIEALEYLKIPDVSLLSTFKALLLRENFVEHAWIFASIGLNLFTSFTQIIPNHLNHLIDIIKIYLNKEKLAHMAIQQGLERLPEIPENMLPMLFDKLNVKPASKKSFSIAPEVCRLLAKQAKHQPAIIHMTKKYFELVDKESQPLESWFFFIKILANCAAFEDVQIPSIIQKIIQDSSSFQLYSRDILIQLGQHYPQSCISTCIDLLTKPHPNPDVIWSLMTTLQRLDLTDYLKVLLEKKDLFATNFPSLLTATPIKSLLTAYFQNQDNPAADTLLNIAIQRILEVGGSLQLQSDNSIIWHQPQLEQLNQNNNLNLTQKNVEEFLTGIRQLPCLIPYLNGKEMQLHKQLKEERMMENPNLLQKQIAPAEKTQAKTDLTLEILETKVLAESPASLASDMKKIVSPIFENEPAKLSTVLKQQRALIIKEDEQKNKVLHYAAYFGNPVCMKELLALNPGMDVKNKWDLTALHIASFFGQATVAQQLIEKGASHSLVSIQVQEFTLECFPLHLAILNSQIEVMKLFLKNIQAEKRDKIQAFKIKGIGNIIHLAVLARNPWVLRELIYHPLITEMQNPADLFNEVNDDDFTPLSLAAHIGNIGAVNILTRHKEVRINETSKKFQRTVLHTAVLAHQLDAIEIILETLGQVQAAQQLISKGDNTKQQKTAYQMAVDLCESTQNQALKDDYELIKNYLDDIRKGNEKNLYRKPAVARVRVRNLVFQGGGPKGIAYSGALDALEKILSERNSALGEIERVAGTSAGAITAVGVGLNFTSIELKEVLNNLDVNSLLDGLDSKDLKSVLGKAEKIPKGGSVIAVGMDILKKAYKLPDDFRAMTYLTTHRQKIWNDFKTLTGLCSGDAFVKWMANVIEKKMKIDGIHKKYGEEYASHLTFGRLAELIKNGEPYKHLYVVSCCITGSPHLVCFNSEDETSKDILIVDAIRASMSIPGVFKPYKIERIVKGERKIEEYLDGGILMNYPIKIFDKIRYLSRYLRGDADYEIFNEETLGFRLVEKEIQATKEQPIKTVLDFAKQLVNSFYKAEALIAAFENKNQYRSISIDNCGVGTLDFDVTEEQKAQLMQSGIKAVQTFFNSYNELENPISSSSVLSASFFKPESKAEEKTMETNNNAKKP